MNTEYSLEGLMLKLQYFGYLIRRAYLLEKTMMLEKTEGRRRGDDKDGMVCWHHQLNGHEIEAKIVFTNLTATSLHICISSYIS